MYAIEGGRGECLQSWRIFALVLCNEFVVGVLDVVMIHSGGATSRLCELHSYVGGRRAMCLFCCISLVRDLGSSHSLVQMEAT